MKELYQCHECGFLSTAYRAFIKVHGELHCEVCARRDHGVYRSTVTKKENPLWENIKLP